MADLNGFDAESVDPLGDFSPIPEDWYLAMIVESDKKSTKSGTGAYLQMKLVITQGEYKGRNLWIRLNLWNPNDQAVQIARSELSSICRAVGILKPKDSTQLHNIPMGIRVVVKKRDDNGQLTNEIKGYQHRQKMQQPAAQAPANGGIPWQPKGSQ